METHAIEQAREILPWWVGWASLISYAPVAFVAALAATNLGAAIALRPLSRGPVDSWSERARLAYPGRLVALVNVMGLPILVGGSAGLYTGALSLVPVAVMAAAGALIAFAAALHVCLQVEERIGGLPVTAGDWIRGLFTVVLIGFPHVALTGLVALAAPATLDERARTLFALYFVGLAAIALGGGLFLAHTVGLARPAGPRVQRIVAAAAARVGVAPKGTDVVRLPMVNAAVLPLCGRLVFSDAAVKRLTDGELFAVCAHELGHLAEPRRVLATRGLAMLTLFPLAAARPIYGTFGPSLLLVAGALSLLGLVALLRYYRHREMEADAVGQSHEEDPGAYARALERLYELNLIPAVLTFGEAHPDLYDRVAAAGITPGYPRPAPPSMMRGVLAAGASVTLAVQLLALAPVTAIAATSALPENDRLLLGTAAVFGRGGLLMHLGLLRNQQGDLRGAVTLLEVATDFEELSPKPPAHLAIVLAGQGRCAEAGAAYSEAEARYQRRPGRSSDWEVLERARESIAACRRRVRPQAPSAGVR